MRTGGGLQQPKVTSTKTQEGMRRTEMEIWVDCPGEQQRTLDRIKLAESRLIGPSG